MNEDKAEFKKLIRYVESFEVEVNTHTKARGNQGLFLRGRIDISKTLDDRKKLSVLIHEFAHFVHSKIEPSMLKTNGSLGVLFRIEDLSELNKIEKELYQVTLFIDEHASFRRLEGIKQRLKSQIKQEDEIIKKEYPKFLRSKKFKDFDKYIRHSKAKHLLSHDRIKLISPFLRKVEYYSIDRLDNDFEDMPSAYRAYLRLRAFQRRQKRVTARMNRLSKYYRRPCELFARFLQSLYFDFSHTQTLAPKATERFFELIKQGYFLEFKDLFIFA